MCVFLTSSLEHIQRENEVTLFSHAEANSILVSMWHQENPNCGWPRKEVVTMHEDLVHKVLMIQVLHADVHGRVEIAPMVQTSA